MPVRKPAFSPPFDIVRTSDVEPAMRDRVFRRQGQGAR
jgi:hypothetical protein